MKHPNVLKYIDGVEVSCDLKQIVLGSVGLEYYVCLDFKVELCMCLMSSVICALRIWAV
jgi:hypothetical protein